MLGYHSWGRRSEQLEFLKGDIESTAASLQKVYIKKYNEAAKETWVLSCDLNIWEIVNWDLDIGLLGAFEVDR